MAHSAKLLIRWEIVTEHLRSPDLPSVKVVCDGQGVWVSLDPSAKTRTVPLPLPPTVVDRLKSSSTEKLPHEVLRARREGWSLQDIAQTLGVSRQWAHVLLNKALDHAEEFPERPAHTVSLGEESRLGKFVSRAGGVEVIRNLIERYSRLPSIIRYERQLGSEDARTVQEFWNDLALLLSETGVSVYTLSSVMGLSKSTLRNGLLRYGVSETTG